MEPRFTKSVLNQGNSMIEEFMGCEPNGESLYHKSIDWLKPVIQKIIDLKPDEFEISRELVFELERVQASLAYMSMRKDTIDFWNEVISAISWYNEAKLKYKEILRLKEETGTTIPREKWGVHETHCCKRHGCKYGEHDACPVTLGLIRQSYGCETGHDFGEDCFEEEKIEWERISSINETFEEYENTGNEKDYLEFKNWLLENKYEIIKVKQSTTK